MNETHEDPESAAEDRILDAVSSYLQLQESGAAPPFEAWLAEQPAEDRAELRRAYADVTGAARAVAHDPGGGATALALPAAPGQVLDDDLELVRVIGSGGMGQVWEAHQRSLDRRVAVKLLTPGRVLDDRSRERFVREARSGARLDHPAIVRVHAYSDHPVRPYLVMELVEGARTLADLIEEAKRADPDPVEHARAMAGLFVEIAAGLQRAHEAGVIHRDIKPHNILVAPDGHPKIADFGLARLEALSALSATGDLVGTLGYMSPEIAQARSIEVDERADVFSLGVTLYEAVTFERAFQGDSLQELVHQVIHALPADPRKVRRGTPDELVAIIARALEKEPRRRFASMGELGAALGGFLRGDQKRGAPRVRWRLRRRRIGRRLAVASAVVVVAAAGLLWVARSGHVAPVATVTSLMPPTRMAPPREGRNRLWLEVEDLTLQGDGLEGRILAGLEAALTERGYVTVDGPEQADYLLRATTTRLDRSPGEEGENGRIQLFGEGMVRRIEGPVEDPDGRDAAFSDGEPGWMQSVRSAFAPLHRYVCVVEVTIGDRHDRAIEYRESMSRTTSEPDGSKTTTADFVRSSFFAERAQRLVVTARGTRLGPEAARELMIPKVVDGLKLQLPARPGG